MVVMGTSHVECSREEAVVVVVLVVLMCDWLVARPREALQGGVFGCGYGGGGGGGGGGGDEIPQTAFDVA